MSSVTQYTDFNDLYTALLNRVREQTGVTATTNQAKNYINTALYDLHIGMEEKFHWAERRGVLITHPTYSTGTVTISQGSTSLSGASTLWNTAGTFGTNNMIAGGKIVIAGTSVVYEISSVTNDTAAVLTSRYVGETVTAGTYVYFEDEYALASDFLRPIDLQTFDDDHEIRIIDRRESRNMFPRNNITGRPKAACFVDAPFSGSTTPVRRIRLIPSPAEAHNIPYTYVTSNLAVTSAGVAQAQLSADSDEPIVPLRYRHVILLHALYNWYRDRKDDARSGEVKGEYESLLTRMATGLEIGSPRARIQMRTQGYRERARNPGRGRGRGRYSTGTAFDEVRD